MFKPTHDDEVRMMTHTGLWPNVLLPIKRYHDGQLDCAYLLDGPSANGQMTIYHGNIFMASKDDPQTTYASVEALLADGWEVD